MGRENHITHLTQAPGGEGSGDGLGVVFGVIYAELEHLARGLMRAERAGHTLGTVGVLHETYIRLIRSYADERGEEAFSPESMRALCARVMRRVLVDHARRRVSRRHADSAFVDQLERSVEQVRPGVIDLIALDEALEDLERLDERKARVVELRFFSAMTMGQIAEILGVPLRTVERDWTFSRAWLRVRVDGGDDEP